MNNTAFSVWFRSAGILLTTLFSLTIVFHLIIVFGAIDFRFVWGGRLETKEQMWVFESVSIALNGFFLWTVIQRMNWVKVLFPQWLLKAVLVLMAVIFALNTVGNCMAKESLERLLFTPLTLISSIGSVILLSGKKRV